jgi:hypothetical protein
MSRIANFGKRVPKVLMPIFNFLRNFWQRLAKKITHLLGLRRCVLISRTIVSKFVYGSPGIGWDIEAASDAMRTNELLTTQNMKQRSRHFPRLRPPCPFRHHLAGRKVARRRRAAIHNTHQCDL